MEFSVYVLQTLDGKRYIGATSMLVKRRWNNGNGYRFCAELWDCICRQGWGSVSKTVVAEKLTLDEASDMEQKLIAEYNTTDCRYGYNRECGGVNQNKIISESTRNKISISQSGDKNRNFGKPRSDECKKKIAESNKGLKRSPETCAKVGKAKEVPVAQYSKNGTLIAVWESGRKAAQATNICASHISKVCKGKYTTAGGFVWSYAEIK